MTDAVFNPPLGSAQIQFVGAQPATTDTTHVPPGFDKLPTGTLLQGFVVNRDPHNNPILRTSMGDVLVKTNVFLKTGSDVVMRVVNNAQQSSAKIISVDGTSIQQLQHQQDLQQTQAKQDLVLQSSMVSNKAAASTAQSSGAPAAYLQGVLLDATTNAAKPHVMAAILNIPTEEAKIISEGANVTFRVIASNLNIAEATARPPTTAAEPSASPAQQATFYQAYSKVTGTNTTIPPLFRPTVEAAHPAGVASLPTPPAVPPNTIPLTASPQPGASTASVPLPNTAPASVGISPAPMPLPLSPTPTAATPASNIPAQSPMVGDLIAPTPLSPATPLAATTPTAAAPLASPATPTEHPIGMPAPPTGNRTAPQLPVPPTAADPQATAALTGTGKLVSPQLLAEPELTQTARAIVAENLNAMTPIHQRPDSSPTSIATQQPQVTHAMTLKTGLINATVIGSEANGNTVLRTPIGTIKLFTDTPPPVNSILQLEVAATPAAIHQVPPTAGNLNVSIPSTSSLLTEWPSLGALQVLAQNNPDLARELATRIPNTKSKLVNSALFFISALRAGSLDQWLGRKSAADIERLAPSLSKQLHSELSVLQSIAQTDPDQPWQIIPFPLQHEQGTHQLRLYVRQDKQKDASKGDAAGTRFVLDLTLSQLGDIQLDGFSRHASNRLIFDLIFRSMIVIPDEMKRDLSTLFEEAATAAQFTGSISFQNNPDLFVHPLDEVLSAHHTGEESSILA